MLSKYGLLLARGFLDRATCQSIIEETRLKPAAAATVYGRSDAGAVDERVRKSSRLTPSSTTVELVKSRLLEYKPHVEQHFGTSLHDVEELQFLRYEVGDFFVAHQDGNTGMIRLDTEADRKVSIVIFLNEQTEGPSAGTYSGGFLKFSDYRAAPGEREFPLSGEAGMLVAFRAELTHEVTPVTAGERYSIVSWYR